jgi:hypothetical protein
MDPLLAADSTSRVLCVMAYVGRDAFMGAWSFVICDCTAILLPVCIVAALRGRMSRWTLAWLVDVACAGVLLAMPDIDGVGAA